MSDVMSQSEIDELLRSISSGGSDDIVATPAKKEAQVYNFASPSKFNKEQLRSFEMIFDNYARKVSSFLTGYLRTTANIEVVSAEQVTYSEFSNALVNPVILSILDFSPLVGSIILELSANVGYAIIDRILGGPGYSMRKLRDFTEIETILLDRVVTQMLTFIPEAWESILEVKPKLEKIETNSQFAQIVSPNEITALITLSIKVGAVEGLINFCIPHLVIEPIMEKLNSKHWFTAVVRNEGKDHTEEIEDQLEKTRVPVAAVIGKTTITVSDFISLQTGDIIPLDSFVNSDMQVYVGNVPKFNAKPGISKGRNAIQITSLAEKEE